MADKKLNSVSPVTDAAYVYAETSNGDTVKISKADLASVVAGLLYIDSIRILKIETTSGGSGVFGNKGLKSFFTYVVDADDRSKFIISHTYLNEGISNPDHKVIVSNALTYGSSNAFGTQNIEGSSGRVIFYLIKFL